MARKCTTTPSTVAPRRKIFVDTGAWYAVASDAMAQRESIDAAFAFDYHFRLFGLDVQPAP